MPQQIWPVQKHFCMVWTVMCRDSLVKTALRRLGRIEGTGWFLPWCPPRAPLCAALLSLFQPLQPHSGQMTLEEQTGACENSWCQHITGKVASISQCLSSFDICAPASMLPAVVTIELELCLANDSQSRASSSPLYPASQSASLLAALWSNPVATHLPTQPGLLTASATKRLYQMLFGGFCVSHLNVQDL